MDRNVVIGPIEQLNREVLVPASPGVRLVENFPFDLPVWVRLRNVGGNIVLLSLAKGPDQKAFPLDVAETLELILAPSTQLFAVRESAAAVDVPVRVWAVTVSAGIPLSPVGRDFSREVLQDAP